MQKTPESAAIYSMGKKMDFDGCYLSTALGSLLGTSVSIGLFSLAGQLDSDSPKVLIGIPAVAALFAGPVLGYYLGIKDKAPESTSPSVVGYSPEKGFRLGMPLIQISKSPTLGNTYHFSLLSGTF